MKWSELISFLESYPSWVKALISGWVLLTAVCAIALLVGRGLPTAAVGENVWLSINGVELFDHSWDRAGVRVTADINGNTFTYPSVGEANWLVPTPAMTPALFKVPPSNVFQITFSMVGKHQDQDDETKFNSQRTTVVRKDQLPRSGTYEVHQLDRNGFRSGQVAAQISFAISNQSN